MKHPVTILVLLVARVAAADPRADYLDAARSAQVTTDKQLAAAIKKVRADKPATLAATAAALAATGHVAAAVAYLGVAAELDPSDATTANNLPAIAALVVGPRS